MPGIHQVQQDSLSVKYVPKDMYSIMTKQIVFRCLLSEHVPTILTIHVLYVKLDFTMTRTTI